MVRREMLVSPQPELTYPLVVNSLHPYEVLDKRLSLSYNIGE
jgi:hypothetical protein